jgi:hypothetical protein
MYFNTLLDIKELDSDMKTLVYENYEKFISATDIIKKVIKIFFPLQLMQRWNQTSRRWK